jgi:hypothetical protein
MRSGFYRFGPAHRLTELPLLCLYLQACLLLARALEDGQKEVEGDKSVAFLKDWFLKSLKKRNLCLTLATA